MLMRAMVKFFGLVQGVNFRYYTRLKAREIGLTGFVRNELDGSVFAVFEGEKDAVEKCIMWCANNQPHAEVTDYQVEWERIEAREYSSFEILR